MSFNRLAIDPRAQHNNHPVLREVFQSIAQEAPTMSKTYAEWNETPSAWSGGDWSGDWGTQEWSGGDWSGSDWSGGDWSGGDWSGGDWSGDSS